MVGLLDAEPVAEAVCVCDRRAMSSRARYSVVAFATVLYAALSAWNFRHMTPGRVSASRLSALEIAIRCVVVLPLFVVPSAIVGREASRRGFRPWTYYALGLLWGPFALILLITMGPGSGRHPPDTIPRH